MRSNPERDKLATEITGLTEKVTDLETQIKALTKERSSLTEVTDLERQVEKLKLEKARMVEDNARTVRETEHKVGLVKAKQDQETAHQKREIELARRAAVLEVRETNLDHTQEEFDKRMAFRDQQFEQQVERLDRHLADFKDMFGDAMKRLPNIDVALTGAVGRPASADDDEERPAARRSSRSRKADED